MIDFGPGLESPMHRAMSIDYGVVLEGEFELTLDSGDRRIMISVDGRCVFFSFFFFFF